MLFISNYLGFPEYGIVIHLAVWCSLLFLIDILIVIEIIQSVFSDHIIVKYFKIYWYLLSGLAWWLHHLHLKTIFPLQLLEVVFHKCQLDQGKQLCSDLCLLNLRRVWLFYQLQREVFKSYAMILELSISPLNI